MVHAIFELAVHYELTYDGRPVADLLKDGYEVSVKFDDSIIQDKNAEINQGIALVGAQLMSKKKFLMDTLGYTEANAEKELAQIAQESKSNAVDVTKLFGGME